MLEKKGYLVHNQSHIEALHVVSPWVYDPQRPGFSVHDHIICIFPSNRLQAVKQDEFKILSIDKDASLNCEYVRNRKQRVSIQPQHIRGAPVKIPIDRFEKFRVNTFFSRNRKTVQIVIFGFMYFTMVGSYFVFSVDTNETVEQGMKVVTDNPYFQIGIICLTLHTITACFYLSYEITDACTSLWSSFSKIFCGRVSLVVEKHLETCFDTPVWHTKEQFSSDAKIDNFINEAGNYLIMDRESPNQNSHNIPIGHDTPQETLVIGGAVTVE